MSSPRRWEPSENEVRYVDRKLSGGERSQLSVSGMERMGWRRVVSGRWRRELR